MGWDDLLTKAKPPVEAYRPAITEFLEGRTARESAGDDYGSLSPETYDKIWKAERRFYDEIDCGVSNRKMRGF